MNLSDGLMWKKLVYTDSNLSRKISVLLQTSWEDLVIFFEIYELVVMELLNCSIASETVFK